MILYRIFVLLVLARWVERAINLRFGWSRVPSLDRISPEGPAPLPRLSIVVPALNEESTVEAAMRTLLSLDYPDLEIIAVNDRSTDRTGEVLDRLSSESPRLRVIHVKELPDGWLGKSHAMHLGASLAEGEWILFTDADVHFEPTALARALRWAGESRTDHLVVMPDVIGHSFWEKTFLGFFWLLFAFRFTPSRISNPRSRTFVGVGAFNLVRAEAYRRSGGHAAMPLEVVDDLMLGKLLKRSGARQACLPAGGLVSVRWIVGLGGAAHSLTKNMFAALRFNPALALLALAMLFGGAVWPAIGLFVGPWETRLACAAAMACMVWFVSRAKQVRGLSPLYGLTIPIGGLILIYILCRSIFMTYRQGGVVWRGTFYPLARLRRGLV